MKTASILSTTAIAAALLMPLSVRAQETQSLDNAGAGNDIVITARRREETLISAPVAVSVVGSGELQRRAIIGVDNLVQSVPQLVISEVGANPQGGIVLIRGIGVGEANPFADQAVSFNVDGLQVSRANIRRVAEVDMAQIEVLKGPQALYFGKNSPAGIIVIHTNDPGDRFEAGANASYELVGDEGRLDGFVSTPITDSLGVRLALFGSHMAGYFRNVYPQDNPYAPDRVRLPHNKDWGGRLTLKFENGGPFDAKLKVSRSSVRTEGGEAAVQAIACPLGYNQLAPGIDDCKIDNKLVRPDSGPNFSAFDPVITDRPYADQDQTLVSLEMNYKLGEQLTLTSATGYYGIRASHSSSFVGADPAHASVITGGYQKLNTDEYSQELRLASGFAGAFNFMVGGYYQDTKLYHVGSTMFNAAAPRILGQHETHIQNGKAWSVFGQLSVKILPTLELSGGGRYSDEKKHIDNYDPVGALIPTVRPERKWNDFSPEATLTWRPTDKFTLYGGYKRGFLSGGFNAGTGNPRNDRSYDQQKIRGFEVGAKALTLDNRLRTGIVLYDYTSTGLQVTATIPRENGTGSDQVVVNAGKARIRGAEFEATLAATDQLSLRTGLAYNHARYKEFSGPCYPGQSIAQGCAQQRLVAGGAFTAQNLSGHRLFRAPDWSLQGGFTASLPFGDDRRLSASADISYSSGYYGQATNKPDSWQSGYALVDSNITYFDDARGYSIGVVGRNLTNKYYFFRSLDQVFTGSGTGTATTTPSDTLALVNRGRQIMLRFSYKLGGR